MSKIFLREDELQEKIDGFLARKNREMELRTSRAYRSRPIFSFKNDSATLAL